MVAGLGSFALVRRSAGQGHGHKPRVTPPRYATLESARSIQRPSMGLLRRPTPGEIVEGGRLSRPCGPGAHSRAISENQFAASPPLPHFSKPYLSLTRTVAFSGPRSVRPETSGLPSPTPSVRRPLLKWSSVTVSRATLWTRLRESGVIIGPIRRLSVLKAMALSATHGAVRGRIRDPIPQEQAVPTSGLSNPGEPSQETRIRQLVERYQVQSALHGSSPWEPRRRSTTWPAPTRRTIPRRTNRALDPGP
jgi:hypothetical protein